MTKYKKFLLMLAAASQYNSQALAKFYDGQVLPGGSGSIVDNGDVAYNTTINSGGIQDIYYRGIAYNTTINSGGIQDIRYGGIAYNTTINSGGIQDIRYEGIAYNATINSGGIQYVYSESISSNTTINSGGTQILESGAKLGDHTIINNDGRIIVGHKGRLSSFIDSTTGAVTTFNGGILEFAPHVIDITFSPAIKGSGIIFMNVLQKLELTSSDNSGSFQLNFNGIISSIPSSIFVSDASNNINLTPYGGAIDVGNFQYGLKNDGNGNWSAYNTGQITDAAKNMGLSASVGAATVNALSNSMHKRVGEIRWQREYDSYHGGWARFIHHNVKVSENNSASGTLDGLEVGYDFKVSQDADNTFLVGLLMQIASGDSDLSQQTFRNGKSNQDAKAFGLYGIWLGQNGWYGDAVMRYHQIDNDVTSYSNFMSIKYNLEQDALSLSLELGKRHDLSNDWFLMPSAQIAFSRTDGDSFNTMLGHGKIDSTNSYRGNLNAMLGKHIQFDGLTIQPYAKGGIGYELDGKTKTELAGYRDEADALHGFRYEFGGGINAHVKERISLFGDISYEKNSDFRDIEYIAGLRVQF